MPSNFPTITGRFPAQYSGSHEALALVKSWMDACIKSHPKCSKTLSVSVIDEDSAPHLPSRVIDVGHIEHPQHPRLVETGGARAHYAALSHCWGHLLKRPLRTKRENFKNHLEEIPLARLPSTYLDALIVTRQIGLQYLWIDSLCIIQGDEADWLQESEKMGSIYEKARLTIAASGAPDSTCGLFSDRSPLPKAVRIPCLNNIRELQAAFLVLPDTKHNGTFDRYKNDSSLSLPDLSPLNSRAWITQEFQLSRRIVHYRKGLMIWSCNSVAQAENGREFDALVINKTSRSDSFQWERESFGTDSLFSQHLKSARSSFWTALVSSYCKRNLTYQSDRLIALRGIVAELQRRWPDQQYAMGLWTESLHEQLLWCPPTEGSAHLTRPKTLKEMGIPTWSWVSTVGPISFRSIDSRAEPVCHISIENGTAVLKGQINCLMSAEKTPNFWPPSFETSFRLRKLEENVNFNDPKAYVAAQPEALTGWNNVKPTEHLMADFGSGPISLAWFDEGLIPVEQVSCFAISRDWKQEPSGEKRWECDVLLLVPSGDISENIFVRLGVGKVIRSEWFDDVKELEVRIV